MRIIIHLAYTLLVGIRQTHTSFGQCKIISIMLDEVNGFSILVVCFVYLVPLNHSSRRTINEIKRFQECTSNNLAIDQENVSKKKKRH